MIVKGTLIQLCPSMPQVGSQQEENTLLCAFDVQVVHVRFPTVTENKILFFCKILCKALMWTRDRWFGFTPLLSRCHNSECVVLVNYRLLSGDCAGLLHSFSLHKLVSLIQLTASSHSDMPPFSQQLMASTKSPSYVFSFSIIRFTWMHVTSQKRRSVASSAP